MTQRALGLPLEQAMELFKGRECRVETALPPFKPQKGGVLRVVRVKECGEAVVLTVSPFMDTVADEKEDA